jgi:hypothetical protein
MNEMMLSALKNWRDLNDVIGRFNEEELEEMLEYEMNNENRKTVVERLHQRFSIVRMARERNQIMAVFKGEKK